jgi:hypothetical protein
MPLVRAAWDRGVALRNFGQQPGHGPVGRRQIRSDRLEMEIRSVIEKPAYSIHLGRCLVGAGPGAVCVARSTEMKVMAASFAVPAPGVGPKRAYMLLFAPRDCLVQPFAAGAAGRLAAETSRRKARSPAVRSSPKAAANRVCASPQPSRAACSRPAPASVNRSSCCGGSCAQARC